MNYMNTPVRTGLAVSINYDIPGNTDGRIYDQFTLLVALLSPLLPCLRSSNWSLLELFSLITTFKSSNTCSASRRPVTQSLHSTDLQMQYSDMRKFHGTSFLITFSQQMLGRS